MPCFLGGDAARVLQDDGALVEEAKAGPWAPRLPWRVAGLCLTSAGGRQDWQVPTVSSGFVSLDFLHCEELKMLMPNHIYEENILWLEIIITAMCKTFQ